MSTSVGKALRWILPFLVTGAILVYLFQNIGLREVFARVSADSAIRLVPVILCYGALSLAIEGVSLMRLTGHAGRQASLATCARIKAASYTVGLLNYALGAAALTVLFRRRVGLGLQASAGLVATVSLTDLAAIMAIALGAVALASEPGTALQVGLVVGTIGALVGGLVVLRVPFSLGPLDRVRDLDLFRVLRQAPFSLLAELAVLRCAFASTFIGAGAGSLWAFGIDVPLTDIVVGMALVALVGALPIAVAGIGTVQLAVVQLFDRWADEPSLLACSLAMQAAMIIVRAGTGLSFAREFTREAAEATRGAEA